MNMSFEADMLQYKIVARKWPSGSYNAREVWMKTLIEDLWDTLYMLRLMLKVGSSIESPSARLFY